MTIKKYEKLSRIASHESEASQQEDMGTLARKQDMSDWDASHQSQQPFITNRTDTNEDLEVADLLDTLRAATAKRKHLIINRGNSRLVEHDLINILRKQIETLGAHMPCYVFPDEATDTVIQAADYKTLTVIAPSAGFRSMMPSGNHIISGASEILCHDNAIARRIDNQVIEEPAKTTQALIHHQGNTSNPKDQAEKSIAPYSPFLVDEWPIFRK